MGWLSLVIGAALGAASGVGITWLVLRRRRGEAPQRPTSSREAEQLVELGQLAGGLAHEIRNPLSTINVNLKLLSEDLARRDDDDHRRWLLRLRGVQEEADRLRGILDDFLRFAGKVEMTLETVDLRRLVGELADFFMPQAEEVQVVLRTALADQPVRCRVDANLLKQAMLNLMINATQAMAGGGEMLIRLAGDDTLARIEVIDTGPGIAAEDVPNLFRAYYSTKAGGTGLGLPTTRRIVREHGGDIRVDSEPGKGTRFILSLPLAAS
jgi:two-component system, NtrC family, sensor histidine kinase HydH